MISDCPTCGHPLVPAPTDGTPCAAVNPATAADVLPLRCELETGHRGWHLHAALWPGTPPLVWGDD